ncbi:MAG TPA: hypothetical protein VKX17_09870 [Planctomycetota bacterium]|nr:hypothetical protein [Planctomycetota bacterium]
MIANPHPHHPHSPHVRHHRPIASHQDNTNLILGIALGISILGAGLIYAAFHKDAPPPSQPRPNTAVSAPAPAPQPDRFESRSTPPVNSAPVVVPPVAVERPQAPPQKEVKTDAMPIDPKAPLPFWMAKDDMPPRSSNNTPPPSTENKENKENTENK